MRNFEYKAIPAPHQGTKAKGVKTTQDRFALSMTEALNEMAVDGWEYVRAETLPCDERKGLTGTQTTYQNILVFRRLEAKADLLTLDPGPRTVSAPVPLETANVAPSPVQSEPVTPRRVVSGNNNEPSSAPPLGGARED
ncbi:MAG: DUF4177 domain-containing protein [Silicimonas sp.]|nr:DUF4177 domain-containing protein [Silicimonas sp.]